MVALPGTYDVLAWSQLMGQLQANKDPLDTILDNVNYLYGNHTPPLLNLCPINGTAQPDQAWVSAVIPSQDDLDYTVLVNTYADGADTLKLDVYSRAADSDESGYPGSWNDELAGGASIVHAGAGNLWTTASTTMSLAGTVRYIHMKIANGVGASNCQLNSICIYPTTIASVSVGAHTSGFIGFDPPHLAGAGAAIHTEYFDRAWANIKAIMRDRYQSVLTFATPVYPDANPYRISAAGNLTKYNVLRCPVGMKGQAGATVNVRVRVEDSGGGSPKLWIYASGADVLEFTPTAVAGGGALPVGADQTGTLTIGDDMPVIHVIAEPSTGLDVTYLHIDWRPGD